MFLNKQKKYSKFVKNEYDSNRQNTSCYAIGNLIQNSPRDSIDLKNNAKIIKHRKFPNSISEPRKTQIKRNEIEYEFNEFCTIHQDQLLYYYCVNCEK